MIQAIALLFFCLIGYVSADPMVLTFVTRNYKPTSGFDVPYANRYAGSDLCLFQVGNNNFGSPAWTSGQSLGLVQTLLSPAAKPNYYLYPGTASTLSSEAGSPYKSLPGGTLNFNWWYRDTPDQSEGFTNVNWNHYVGLMTLTLQNGAYVFDSSVSSTTPNTYNPLTNPNGYYPSDLCGNNQLKSGFFPIDACTPSSTWLSGSGGNHQFSFTTEIHTYFQYTPGNNVWSFSGDDDVWVFINDQLAMDLGGIHPRVAATIYLDDVNKDYGVLSWYNSGGNSAANTKANTILGLVPFQIYPLDIFNAERHTTESNFRVTSTFASGCSVLTHQTESIVLDATNVNFNVINQASVFTFHGVSAISSVSASGGGKPLNLLTVASGANALGIFWYSVAQSINNGFTATFSITSTKNQQGQGFAFVVQSSGLNSYGSGGTGLGYRGMGTYVAVRFERQSNSDFVPVYPGFRGHSPYNYVPGDLVLYNIIVEYGSPTGDLTFAGSSTLPSWTTSVWTRINIDGNAPINYKIQYLGTPTWLMIYVDDLDSPAMRVRLPSSIGSSTFLNSATNNSTWVGFTTANPATSPYAFPAITVNSFGFYTVPTSNVNSVLSWNGAKIAAGVSSSITGGSITFTPYDACANLVTSTGVPSLVTLTLTPSSGGSTIGIVTSVVANPGGTYTLSYSVNIVGTYTISVTYSGVAVTTYTSGTSSLIVVSGVISPAKSTFTYPTASIPACFAATAGLPANCASGAATIAFIPYDAFTNYIIDSANIPSGTTYTVSFSGPGSIATQTVAPTIYPGNTLQISPLATAAGPYTVTITYGGVTVSTGSITIVGGATLATHSTASGTGTISAQVGVTMMINILARDIFNNVNTNPLDTFTISVSPALSQTPSCSSSASNQALPGGSFNMCTYVVGTKGTYTVTVSLSGANAGQIVGSPFTILAGPGIQNCAKTLVAAPTTNPVNTFNAGQLYNFVITPYDGFNNPLLSASSVTFPYTVTISGTGATSTVAPNGAAFLASVQSPTVGSSVVTILCGGNALATTYTETVIAGPIYPSKTVVTAIGSLSLTSGSTPSFTVLTEDQFGNSRASFASTDSPAVLVQLQLSTSSSTIISCPVTAASNTITASCKPVTLVGTYNVQIFVSGTNVVYNNQVVISAGAPSAANFVTSGTGLVGGVTQTSLTFSITPNDANFNAITPVISNNVCASIILSTSPTFTINNPSISNGACVYTYTAPSTASYALTAYVGSSANPVKGSPYAIKILSNGQFTYSTVGSQLATVLLPNSNAQFDFIIAAKDSAVQTSAVPTATGQASAFSIVQASTAGQPGTLTGVVVDAGGGYYNGTVIFTTATVNSKYYVNVLYQGIALTASGTQNIAISVNPGAASSATSYVSTSSATAVVGIAQTATVHLLDSYGNSRGTLGSSDSLSVNINPTPTTLTKTPNSDGTVTISYTFGAISATTSLTSYSISVALQSGGTQFVCSPSCSGTVTAGAASASMSTLTLDNNQYVAGSVASFSVQAIDSSGNIIFVGGNTFTMSLVPSTGSPISVPLTSANSNGMYTGTYTLTLAGTYTVTFNGVNSKAFSIAGSGSYTSFTVKNSNADATKTVISSLSTATAGTSVTYTVTLLDAYSNPVLLANPVYISPSFSPNLATSVSVTGPTNSNVFTVTFQINVVGTYSVTTSIFTGTTFTPFGNGLTLSITPAAVSASQSQMSCGSLTTGCGLYVNVAVDTASVSFIVILNDQFGNKVTNGGDLHSNIAVTYGGISATSVVQSNTDASTYIVTVSPPTTLGSIQINVMYSGVPIFGSGTASAFMTAGAASSKSILSDLQCAGAQPCAATFTIVAGSTRKYKILSRDNFNNPIKIGGASFSVILTGTINNPTRSPVYQNCTSTIVDSLDGSYSFSLDPTLIGMTGSYTLTISLNSNPIVGSGQTFVITPLPYVFGGSSVSLSSNSQQAIAGVPTSFKIQLNDMYGNNILDSATNAGISITMVASAINTTAGVQEVAYGTSTNSGGNNGVHTISYMVPYPGNYQISVSIGDQNAINGGPAGVQSLSGSPLSLTVVAFTCAGRDSTKPFNCNGTCVANLDGCSSQSCPLTRPLRCPDNTCVSDITTCNCTAGYTTCPFGPCAFGNSTAYCLVNQACPGTQVRCGDLSCAATASACPTSISCSAGYVLCPDFLTCAASTSQCPSAPSSLQGNVCPGNAPLLCSDRVTCVGQYSNCPSQSTCPSSAPIKCSDGSCQLTTSQCLPPQVCYAPLSVSCSSGSCASKASDCPTVKVCPASAPILCESNQCVQSILQCGAAISCPASMVICPTGACAPSYPLCPSESVCPPLSVKCWDNSCVSALSLCPAISQCPSNLIYCPDGSCALTFALCPTAITCPSTAPVLCADDNCVTDISLCGPPTVCPASRPLLCPGGSCATALINCPQATICPTDHPVKCFDGTCATDPLSCPSSVSNCPATPSSGLTFPGTSGSIRCPDGSCRASLSVCPTELSCQPGYVKCWDNSCRLFDATARLTAFGAAPGLATCVANTVSQNNLDFACKCDITQGQVLCNGGCQLISDTCTTANAANQVAICEAAASAAALQICQANYANFPCPTYQQANICGGATPLTCWDHSCRANLNDCPSQIICPASSPVRCPDSTCAVSVLNCVSFTVCNAGDTLCGDGTCSAIGVSGCNPLPYCPKTSPFMCFDATCRVSPQDCPLTPVCPRSAPFLCPYGGGCVASRVNCQSVGNSITYALPIRCNDGNVVASISQCVTPISTSCPFGGSLCSDGSCRTDSIDCPNSKCPFYLPVTCQSGQCARTQSECIVTANCTSSGNSVIGTTCFDGSCSTSVKTLTCPVAPTCDPFSYRCDDGLCVASLSLCPSTPAVDGVNSCPPSSPYRCADGTCQIISAYCKVLKLCGVGSQTASSTRCLDGSCVSGGVCNDANGNPIQNTCPSGFIRCTSSSDNGRCVPTAVGCRQSNGCPINSPNLCIDGTCSSSVCTITNLAFTSGCRPNKGVQCWDGSCANATSLCPSTSGCPAATPFRCTSDGSCQVNFAGCPTSIASPTYTCSNGAFVTSADKCPMPNNCNVTAPIRCVDGTCNISNGCKPMVICPADAPFRCADNTCKGTENLCNYLPPCPANLPYRCNDLSCQSSAAFCLNICPTTSPIQCGNGNCVSVLNDCSNTLNIIPGSYVSCASPNVLCFDGSCASSTANCPDHFASDQACITQNPLTPVLCTNGLCAASTASCLSIGAGVIAACPSNDPVRCGSGVCAANATMCGTPPTCPTAETLCQDGICRATCLPFNGCDLNNLSCPGGSCIPFTSATASSVTCAGSSFGCANGLIQCSDFTCVSSISLCPIDVRSQIPVPSSIVSSCGGVTQLIITSATGSLLAILQLPPASVTANSSSICTSQSVSITPVADSVAKSFTTLLPINRIAGFNGLTALPYELTVLSPVLNIGLSPNAVFYQNALLEIMSNNIQQTSNRRMLATGNNAISDNEKCLAIGLNNQWICVTTPAVYVNGTNVMYSGSINSSGIYAIIYNPQPFPPPPPTDTRSFLQKYWQELVGVLAGTLVLCICGGYIIFRLQRYRQKWKQMKNQLVQKTNMDGLALQIYRPGQMDIIMNNTDEANMQVNPLNMTAQGAAMLEAQDNMAGVEALKSSQEKELAEKRLRVEELKKQNAQLKKNQQQAGIKGGVMETGEKKARKKNEFAGVGEKI